MGRTPGHRVHPTDVRRVGSGNGSKVYRSNFYEVPGDAWLKIYWFLFCAMLIYLLVWTLCGLLVLRRVPRHRPYRDRVPRNRRRWHRGVRRTHRHPVV